MANGDDPISELVLKLQTRQLLKRCFIVCREYVDGIENDQDISARYERLCTNMRDIFEGQIELRTKVIDRINEKTVGGFGLKDVYIDLPDVPALEDTAATPVKLPSGEIQPMSDYFQLEGWQKLYELKKLRGYFFITPQVVEAANEAFQELLSEEYGLKFNPLASQLAQSVSLRGGFDCFYNTFFLILAVEVFMLDRIVKLLYYNGIWKPKRI